MKVRVLGNLEVESSGGSVALTAPSHRELLALLSVYSPAVVSDDRLIDAFWPGETADQRSRRRLQQRVFQLNKKLKEQLETEDDFIVRRGSGYGLRQDVEVDVKRMKSLVEEAESWLSSDPAGARSLVEEGLALWRGEAYSDFEYAEWAALEIAVANAARRRANELRIEAGIALGEGQRHLEELRAAVENSPLDEHLRSQYMWALFQSGRQADATSQYEDFRTRLVDQTGLEPQDEIQDTYTKILTQATELQAPPVSDRVSRPPVFARSFFGREREIADLVELLGRRPLITLTGIGGSGKTSLAIEVARRVGEEYPGGPVFVDLSSTAHRASVDSTVAAAFGLRQSPGRSSVVRLSELLRARPSLLLLDNCEQVLDGVAKLVGELLRTVPGAHILATSRHPLGVDGEQRFPVGPLAHDIAELASAAVELLLDRAALSRARPFEGNKDRQAAAEICRLLGGLPLAIELAAQRSPSRSLPELARKLGDELDVGNDPLRGAVEWTYGFLDDDGQTMFRTLGVSIGGRSATALAEWPAHFGLNEKDVVTVMDELVSTGLVSQVEIDSETRYEILEPIRQDAHRRLQEANELEAAKAAHMAIYGDLASKLRFPMLLAPKTAERISIDLGNFTAAMQRALEGERPEAAAKIAEALDYYWVFVGRAREGRRWIDRIIEAGFLQSDPLGESAKDEIDHLILVAGIQRANGFLASVDLAHDAAEEAFKDATALYDAVVTSLESPEGAKGDQGWVDRRRLRAVRYGAWTRFLRARNLTSQHFARFGVSDEGEEWVRQADLLYREARKTFEREQLLMDLAYLIPFVCWNDRQIGAQPLETWPDFGLGLATDLGLPVPQGIAQTNLALHYLGEGEALERAWEYGSASAETFREVGDLYSLQIALTAKAVAAHLTGRDKETVDALSEALEIVTELGRQEWESWTIGLATVLLAAADIEEAGQLVAWLDERNEGWRNLLAATGVPQGLVDAAPAGTGHPGVVPLTSTSSAATVALNALTG